ncbi:MAG: MCE family protein [Actinomycetota bacterium]|nr:MCE family protein [Acidimicrobiia bacterium]MDQ3293858.1 MCE family protein [Actinomycetota bacterium]
MKSFRDRNPYAVGLIGVLVIGLFTGAAFAVGLFHLLEHTYTVRAEFDDAAGLKAGNEVRLAGVKVGRVASIEVQHEHGTVIVSMEVQQGTELGDNTTAEIALGTLLGAKFVRLDYEAAGGSSLLEGSCDAGEDGERCDAGAPLIPREQAGNRVPYDVFRLTRVATEGIEELDTEGLNSFVNDLADLTEDRREPVTRLINSIDDVSLAITSRDQQLGELLARADSLSATLAEKDETLVALIDQSRAILQLLESRRAELTAALGEGARAVTALADVIAENEVALDRLLTNLHPTLQVARDNLDDVNRALAWAGPAFYGQALAGTHGPWLDIYVRGLGPDIAQVLCDVLAPGSVCS